MVVHHTVVEATDSHPAASTVRATATGTAASTVRATVTGIEAATIARATVIRIRDRVSASRLAQAALASASAVRMDAQVTSVIATRPADLERGD